MQISDSGYRVLNARNMGVARTTSPMFHGSITRILSADWDERLRLEVPRNGATATRPSKSAKRSNARRLRLIGQVCATALAD